MRVAVKIELTSEERQQLEQNVRPPIADQRLYLRSRIILLSAAGRECVEIAALLGVSEKTCRKWRNRFAVERMAGILDLERSGAPELFTRAERAEIIRMASTAPALLENWTLANVTAEVRQRFHRSVSVETIRQILKSAAAQAEVPSGVVLRSPAADREA
jgi:putative transposase